VENEGAKNDIVDANSTADPCGAGGFQCQGNNLTCITWEQVCNDFVDCPNFDDEAPEMCNQRQCGEDMWFCKCGEDMWICNDEIKECIQESWKCDGDPDCHNGFDEHPKVCNSTADSTKYTADPCGAGGFQCQGDNLTCITQEQVCDHIWDCPNFDDEAVGCTTSCDKIKDKCEHKCQGDPQGGEAQCVCNPGYKMDEHEKCVDINECADQPVCSQVYRLLICTPQIINKLLNPNIFFYFTIIYIILCMQPVCNSHHKEIT
jgi:hypothetical protein